MRRELSCTDSALTDLGAAKRWLMQPGSGSSARRQLAAIWASIEALRDRPYLLACGVPVDCHGKILTGGVSGPLAPLTNGD